MRARLVRRLGGLDIAACVALLGLLVFAARSMTGGALGIELGAECYVTGLGEERGAQGDNREVIEVGDRVVSIVGRPVSSLAEVGDVLRSLDPSAAGAEVITPIMLERYDYRYGESLNYREVQEQGFPTHIEPTDRVVGYDEHDVRGDIDRATVLSILNQRPGERVTFYFERPRHTYRVELPVKEPGLPAGPLLLLALSAVVVGLLAWRARRSPSSTSQGIWLALGWVTTAAPWALLLLWDPAMALRDPLLLGLGLLALALYRPGALELHRRLFGGQRHPMLTLAIFLPATVVAFLGGMLTLEIAPALWGAPVVAGKELDVIGLLRTACGLLALYQILDVILWMRRAGGLRQRSGAAQLAAQLGLLLSTLALVSAVLFWARDSALFLSSGFVVHAAGLVLTLWLGDMAVAALPALEGRERRASAPLSPHETSAALCEFLTRDVAALGLYAPELVVVRGRLAMVMTSARDLSELAEGDDPAEVPLSLSVSRTPEELRAGVGLLRDEAMSLPLPLERPTGREEHSGEVTGAEEVVRSVVDHLRVGTAFSLLDEVDALSDEAALTEREGAFYVWLLDYGAPNHGMEYAAMQALRRRFMDLWPGARQLVLESLLREEGVTSHAAARLSAPASSPLPAPAPREIIREVDREVIREVDREVIREVDREVRPPDDLYLRRDAAEAWPADEPGLLEDELEAALEALARDDAPIVLVGPPGIGRQFVARRLHALTGPEEPFVRFPVARIPPSVREIELFGDDEDPGHLRAAAGGVLYIDNAVELGDELLTHLLSISGELDAETLIVLGVRTRAGVPLEEAIARLEGSLGELTRGLLSHRVVRLRALEHRPAWVRLVVDHGLQEAAMKHGRVILEVAEPARAHLKARRWPGGVPELRFALEQAVLRCDGDTLLREHFAPEGPEAAVASGGADADPFAAALADADDLRELYAELEHRVFEEAMRRASGDANAAARLLGIKRAALTRGLKPGGGGGGRRT